MIHEWRLKLLKLLCIHLSRFWFPFSILWIQRKWANVLNNNGGNGLNQKYKDHFGLIYLLLHLYIFSVLKIFERSNGFPGCKLPLCSGYSNKRIAALQQMRSAHGSWVGHSHIIDNSSLNFRSTVPWRRFLILTFPHAAIIQGYNLP